MTPRRIALGSVYMLECKGRKTIQLSKVRPQNRRGIFDFNQKRHRLRGGSGFASTRLQGCDPRCAPALPSDYWAFLGRGLVDDFGAAYFVVSDCFPGICPLVKSFKGTCSDANWRS